MKYFLFFDSINHVILAIGNSFINYSNLMNSIFMKCKLFVSLIFMGFVLISCGQANSNGDQAVSANSNSGETITAAAFKHAIAMPGVQV